MVYDIGPGDFLPTFAVTTVLKGEDQDKTHWVPENQQYFDVYFLIYDKTVTPLNETRVEAILCTDYIDSLTELSQVEKAMLLAQIPSESVSYQLCPAIEYYQLSGISSCDSAQNLFFKVDPLDG